MIRLLIYLGSALMVYNIYGFVRFSRYVRRLKQWDEGMAILRIPVVLLVLFLLGYLTVGLFGHPDLVVAGILFGGSIFVFVMYRLLSSVTNRILEGEELSVRLKTAEESARMKSEFLDSVSHEMRTPMNVILGLVNTSLSDPGLPKGTREKLEKTELSAHHLLTLINNLLDMNSVESDSLTLQRQTFRLSDALWQLEDAARTMCEHKGLEFSFTAPEDADGSYCGDLDHLRKVLLSIANNAVKFTDVPGAVRFDVACGAESETARTFSFSITDTGVGIDPDFLPHLFTAFGQEDASSTSRFGGGGLSLALAKHIIDLMGGDIAVRSEKGVGSTFTVTLPLELVREEASPKAPAEEVSLAGRHALIVEDIPDNAEIAADLLELEGMESDHAENGRVGLDMFARSPCGYYDAILMDLRMPVMDGLEATRRIRALDRPDAKTIPIIAVTANAFERDVKQSLAAGMDAHLAKPAGSDVMYDTLRHLIAERVGKGGVAK